jgi:SAM-dependent methyltransferase
MTALTRVLEAETLDHLAADDPAAQRARRDLRRVNAAMGARRILERALARALGRGRRGLRLLEIGCGDGRLLLDVAKHRGDRWPDAHLDLLDQQPIVDAATVAAYAACGWRARPLTADVLDWARSDDGERWDAVVANLFLHHFDDARLRSLLAGCARRADALVACEPRRSRVALAASHLIVFLGASAVTRHDGVVSVRAGFVGDELTSAWPLRGDDWELAEYEDGAFTHCFCAVRRGPAS